MARTIVLLALLAVLVNCQSGCGSIDVVNIPYSNNPFYTQTAITPVLLQPNARVSTLDYDPDNSQYFLRPFTTSVPELYYSTFWSSVNANTLQIVQDFFANNSTADRKVLILSTSSSGLNGEDYSAFIAAARRLKQSGVEIILFSDNSYGYESAWQQVASPNSFFPNTYCCGIDGLEQVAYALTGVNASSCAILGANTRISTFDENTYVFNGLGDYWLVKSINSGSGYFGIQIRMEQCDNSEAPSSGTCTRAVAFRTPNHVVVLYVDPVTSLLTIQKDGTVVDRFIEGYSTIGSLDGYNINPLPLTLPNSQSGYVITFNGNGKEFGFLLSDKMSLNAFMTLTPGDLGTTVGLCGTFDGCSENDYYSADQVFVSTGESDANIYNGFAETWRVSADESFFTDFDNNYWYYANYPEYTKDWNPRMDAIPVTTSSAQSCEMYADASKYLYETCTDSVALGHPEYNYGVDVLLTLGCIGYCGESGQFALNFVEKSYCDDRCPVYYTFDYFGVYNDSNLPYYSVDMQNTYAATAQFALGGTYTVAYASDYCDSEEANATVTITCDESPVVDAGADITVSRSILGASFIFLSATATDVNTKNLQYSWRVIEAPMARNTSDQDGYWNPQGYASVDDVNFFGTFLPTPYFIAEYPGIYVMEVAAYDGCSISYDTVTINVTCDKCGAPVITSYPSASYLETTSVYGYSSVSLSSTPNEYVYPFTLDNEWVLESTSNNYAIEMQYTFNKVYNLYTVYTDNVINTTIDISNSTSSYDSSSSGIITDNQYLNRYEGNYVSNVHTETVDVTTSTYVFLSSVESKELTCMVTIPGYQQQSASFQLTTVKGSDNNYPAAFCNGDYNFRVDYSDECYDASDKFTVTHRCVKSPVALLVACDPNWKFDYDAVAWPSNYVDLDAQDSYSESTGVSLQYIFNTLSQPAWDTNDVELYFGPANSYRWFLPGALLTQTAAWEFQVNVRDDCSFGTSEKASVHLSCDDQSPVIYSSVTTIKSSNGTAGWNTFTLDSSASSNPHDTISGYLFDLVSGDPLGTSAGDNFPLAGSVVTLALTKAGTYTFVARTFDGCWWKNSSAVTVTYTCDATITPSVAITPSASAAYDTNTNTWPSFTLDGAASTVNVNRMAYNWDITTPSGITYNGVSTSNALTVNTAFYTEVGAYVATFTLTDGCRTVVQNYTVTVTCPALATVTLGVAGTTVTNGSNPADVHFYTTPETVGIWTIYDAQGNAVVNTLGANATLTSATVQTYTAVFSYGNGCQVRSLNRTFAATCQWNPTFPLTTSTVTWSHNKFPRFTLAPTVTGQNPAVPAYGYLNWIYRVLSAPSGSVWAPMNSTITYSNITSNGTYGQMQIGDIWVRGTYQTVTTTTVTSTKVVLLNNGNEWFEGCFAADIAGDYSVQLSVIGYCSEYIVSTVTVSARCNTAPVATATYTQEVATGSDFRLPIVIDGLGSSDVDGDNLTYIWEVVSVPANSPYLLNDSATQDILIKNRFLGRTTLTSMITGTYGLRLTVSDGCSNTTTDLSVVVSCNNNLAIANPQQSHEFDGFTPVSMSQFTFVATDRCDLQQYWDVIAFTPAEKGGPAPEPQPTSGASEVAMSLFALFALIALLL